MKIICLILALLLLPFAMPFAYTQDTTLDTTLERVEVTGSHIKRIDVEGTSPIQVLDRDFIDNSGYNSVSDVLRDITASSFGAIREQTNTTAHSASLVDLRGLGPDRTLVLLNGKRLPVDPNVGGVDLNLIPMGSVERIDILKDGASATYGSDALGGVVNIITRKDFVGSQASVKTSVNKYKGGERTDASLLHGYATNKFRLLGVANFRANQEIKSKDRKWTKESVSFGTAPANRQAVTLDTVSGTLTAAHDDELNYTGSVPPYTFNPSDYSNEVPNINQFSAMIQTEYKISPDMTAYARLTGNHNRMTEEMAPNAVDYLVPLTIDAVPVPPPVDAHNRWLVSDRLLEMGNRITKHKITSYGGQIGLKGYLFDTWSWDGSYDYNKIKKERKGVNGFLLEDRWDALIASNGYNPFKPIGQRVANQTDYDATRYQTWTDAQSENHLIEVKASGEIFNLLGRPVNFAVGTMFSKEKYFNRADYESDDSDATGGSNVLGGAGTTGGGNRRTLSLYTEFIYNPIDDLEVQLSGRFDNYDDFGNTVNPKLGLRWQLLPQIMMRASAGTGFKAPTLPELYESASLINPYIADAYYCQQSGYAPSACGLRQYEVRGGGNKHLKEETSRSYNLGAVYQLDRKTSLALDLWRIELDDVIGMDLDEATKYEAIHGAGSAAQYGINIPRDNLGRIFGTINANPQNLGSRNVTGIDMSFAHETDNSFGTMSIKIEHALLLSYKEESFPTMGHKNVLREHGKPKWKNNTSFGYTPSFYRQNSFYLIAKTTSQSKKREDSLEGQYLKRYTEWDFQYNLQLPWKASFTFGVINLFNSTPPLDETNVGEQLNSEIYNPVGQSFYAQYVQSF